MSQEIVLYHCNKKCFKITIDDVDFYQGLDKQEDGDEIEETDLFFVSETIDKKFAVLHDDFGNFFMIHDGIIRHPFCDEVAIIRAMTHYLSKKS